jgi:O-antigen ligase
LLTTRTPNNLPEILDSRWYAFADLLFVTLACVLWATSNGNLGWWPLLIALLPWPARLLNGRFPLSRTPYDWLVLLFLIMAFVGTWTAYNHHAAWSKFWLIVGAVLLFYALAAQPPENVWPVWTATGILGALIAFTFLLTYDWSGTPAKFFALRRLQETWSAVRPQLATERTGLLPNEAGGLMAMLAPALAASAVYWLRQRKWLPLSIAVIGGAVLVAGLLMSASRGAWLALAGGLVVWLLWYTSGISVQSYLTRRRLFLLLLATLTLVIIAVIYLFLGGPAGVAQMLPGPNRVNRLYLNRDTVNLIADYVITGSGLDTFPGQYSQYSQITPVFLFDYAHNLYLDVALELGLGGLIILLAIFGLTFWLLVGSEFADLHVGDNEPLRGSLLAGLFVILFHGFVDDPLFASRGLLLLFVFSGISTAITHYAPSSLEVFAVRLPRSVILLSAVLLLSALAAILLRRSILSSWNANLGAVEMSQIELDEHWPTNQWQGDSKVAQMAGAESRFNKALTLNNSNVTALFRLGLIALARQDFNSAAGYLSAAYLENPEHRGVQKALGYSALWNGDLQTAEELLSTLPESKQELDAYIYHWQVLGEPELSERALELLQSLQEH